jgi:hypothetical protein
MVFMGICRSSRNWGAMTYVALRRQWMLIAGQLDLISTLFVIGAAQDRGKTAMVFVSVTYAFLWFMIANTR